MVLFYNESQNSIVFKNRLRCLKINDYIINYRKDEQINYLTEELRKMKHEEELRKTKLEMSFRFKRNGMFDSLCVCL